MKKILIFLAALCLSGNAYLFAQDTMILQTGEELQVIVKEVGVETIWYKKLANPDGPDYSIPRADVFMIKYENGTQDVFGAAKQEKPQVVLYTRKEPVLSCLFSILLPGGGQYYNGEYKKGGIMTGLFFLSYIGMAASIQSDNSYYDYSGNYHADGANEALGAICALTAIGTYLWSIIDAPIVSNRINREIMLKWNLGKNAELRLRPNVEMTTQMPTGRAFYSPNFGAKLVLSLK
jgi:hypothetical protein